ncbi:MAG: hypothetical protein K2M06_01380 [Muribaculaceae bacterium]|nr:hypothetical protein [Muribaculaceae bacterium]
MNKKIFAIAMMALVTIGGSSAFAARQDKKQECSAADCAKKECIADSAKCDKQKCHKKGPKTELYNPFEGLNLSADQQAKLDKVREDIRKEQQAARQQAQADRQKARSEAKTKADQGRRDYLAKVKEILSPEQYVQFLENEYVNAKRQFGSRMDAHGKAFRGKHDASKMKGKKKAQRPEGKPDKPARSSR